MAIPGTGTVSFSDLQTEFGGENPISISEYYRGGDYTTDNNTDVPVSGVISVSDFYGAELLVAGSVTFSTSGSYSWTIPSGITSVTVTVTGGSGGGASGYYTYNAKFNTYTAQFGGDGGGGATAVNTFSVSSGNTLIIIVGAGGNGGAAQGFNTTAIQYGAAGAISSVTYLGTLRSFAGGGPGGTYSDEGNGLGGNGGYNNGAGGSGADGSVTVDYS